MSSLFGVIYATNSAIIRRYVYPTYDGELVPSLCGPGESLITVSRGPYPDNATWQIAVNNAVFLASGKQPGNPVCCVVDKTNTVTQHIMADPALDSLPNATLVQAYATIPVGSTYDPVAGLFTSPQVTIPAFAGNANKPATLQQVIPPAVIPNPNAVQVNPVQGQTVTP